MRVYRVTTQNGTVVASDAEQIIRDVIQLLTTADVGGQVDLSVQVLEIDLNSELPVDNSTSRE
jgi:hypothetical protein